MFRTIFPIFLTLAIALMGGIYSADRVTKSFEGFGALQIGGWTAWPSSGSINADPYSRAHAARAGTISLGGAEGLLFTAYNDDSGQPIRAECKYLVSGEVASARFWTLRSVDQNLRPVGQADEGPIELYSGGLIRQDSRMFRIIASKTIVPSNWLKLGGTGERAFILTLYDTSIATTTGISEIAMPAIERIECTDE